MKILWNALLLQAPGPRFEKIGRAAAKARLNLDCIHYKVSEDRRILSRAAYVVLGVTTEGHKEILSITAGANERARSSGWGC